MRRLPASAAVSGLLLLTACSAPEDGTPVDPAPPPSTSSPSAPGLAPSVAPTPLPLATPGRTVAPSPEPAPAPTADPEPRTAAMLATVRELAGRIGPREATSPAFAEAAALVGRRFEALGYRVERQRFRVPAGDSWGVPVRAGTSVNVVATPPGFDPARPYRLVGAHLDTVPQAPGAEDNASGVAVVLELARLAAERRPSVPVVLVAFGAEEPRGPGDDLHHFGSTAYVDGMTAAARRSLVGMLSLDRVGVGSRVPVGYGGRGDSAFAREVRATARRAGVPSSFSSDNTTSDHWSFEKAGLPAARLGSTPYDEYHSARDRPGVVSGDQLVRTATVAWRVVSSPAPR